MKISRAETSETRRLLWLPILAGAMLATIGAQPALAQRDEQRFQNEERFQNAQRWEERRDERWVPPGQAKRHYRPTHYGYYETPRYVYAPPPVVYAPPSGLEFVFPLTFR
jgi:hypothetical protein